MASRVGKYKVSKKESALNLTDGGDINGDLVINGLVKTKPGEVVFNAPPFVPGFQENIGVDVLDNHTASQVFTKRGPLAFLPISSRETSVVISFKGKDNINFKNLIKKHNLRYKILKMNKIFNFKLKSSNLRCYHHENFIAFGDLLHKLHPLAGQGFNMNIRDIKEIEKLIKTKIENGLNLDKSICFNFEKNTKAYNYLFSSGIDLIYEFFNIESRANNNTLSKLIKFLGNKKFLNNFFKKVANNGLAI